MKGYARVLDSDETNWKGKVFTTTATLAKI